MSKAGSSERDIAAMKAPEAAVVLQERLHNLLTRMSAAVEHLKTWPEAKGDEASVHVESTSKLIGYIRNIVHALQRVEAVVQSNADLRKKLQECSIPHDLLDLIDVGPSEGLNPDCFVRGLLKEALGQLAGLKRRKLALGLLSNAVEAGLKKKILEQQAAGKRDREDTPAESELPPAKKHKA